MAGVLRVSLNDWLDRRLFELVHGHNLVYNTCWEDPRLDRAALELGRDDTLLAVTSAGCNVLDYALTGPRHIHAVDLNPRQSALLELKLAGIRHLDFDRFFGMFGRGCLPEAREAYRDLLRADLSPWSQRYWDRWIGFFSNPHRSFFFRGAAGLFAQAVNVYVNHVIGVRPHVDAMLEAPTLELQREIWESRLRERFWSRAMRFAIDRHATLSMVGVPKAQRRQVESHYDGGIVAFAQDCLDAVFGRLPLSDNYFWRVYLTGRYTPECCPEYLKPVNFKRLKAGLADRISVHTDSVQHFLETNEVRISRYVLLDHMDWLSDRHFPALVGEWQAILARAAAGARAIWRSGGLRTDFLDRVVVEHRGRRRPLQDFLFYHRELAADLHARDRVHTYGSFAIADVTAAA